MDFDVVKVVRGEGNEQYRATIRRPDCTRAGFGRTIREAIGDAVVENRNVLNLKFHCVMDGRLTGDEALVN